MVGILPLGQLFAHRLHRWDRRRPLEHPSHSPHQGLKLRLSLALALLLASCSTLRPRGEICDGSVVFLEDREFVVNSNADKLICGDADRNAWKEIPPGQQELMVRGLLKKQGYHQPTFRMSEGKLLVTPGARSRIRDVRFLQAPDEFFDYKPPKFEGRPITTDTLNQIEAWALNRLREVGYPCASVETLASIEEGSVLLNLQPRTRRTFPWAIDFSEDELKPSVENRYRAFHSDLPYRASLLTLSSQRMERDGIANRSIYEEKCEDNPGPETPPAIPIQHRVTLGPARLVQIGFGFSTEEYFLTRASWKNTRVGSQASLLSATVRASFIEQQLSLVSNQYLSEAHPRLYLAPKFSYEHHKERNQEYHQLTLPLHLGASREFKHGVLRAELGPELTYENVLEGPVLGKKRLLLGTSVWTYQTHAYEFHQGRPREGAELQLDTSSVVHSLEKDAKAHRGILRGTYLWNVGPYDPARWVVGVRWKFHSIFKDRTGTNLNAIPIEYFTWLGGEEDMRGFGRRELPFDRNGAQSSAYLGTEIRAPVYFNEALDPLVFLDLGMLGSDSEFRLDPQVFYSPGFGVRYQSPVGAIRATAAHGFVPGGTEEGKTREHFQFYLSLGREF